MDSAVIALIKVLPEAAYVFAVGVLTGAGCVGWWARRESKRADRMEATLTRLATDASEAALARLRR